VGEVLNAKNCAVSHILTARPEVTIGNSGVRAGMMASRLRVAVSTSSRL
jgi:hypothetical protein